MPRRSTFNLEFIIKPPSRWSGTLSGVTSFERAQSLPKDGLRARNTDYSSDWLVRTSNSPTHRGRSPPRSKRQSQGIGRVHRPIEQRLKKTRPTSTPSARGARSIVLRVAPRSSGLPRSGRIPAGAGHSGQASIRNGSRPSANVPAPKPSVHRVAAGQLPPAAAGSARRWVAAAVARSRCLSNHADSRTDNKPLHRQSPKADPEMPPQPVTSSGLL
jgi:hypothetical protein